MITYDLNKPQETAEKIFIGNEGIAMFSRGSSVYGTMTAESDRDVCLIVSDECEIVDNDETLNNEKADKRIHQFRVKYDNVPDIDVEIVKHSDFIELINEHDPLAIEGLLLTEPKQYKVNGYNHDITEYRQFLTLDKYKIRESFGKVSNNSFAKAKKKMTVKKDLDLLVGAKSLFHSLRLLGYATQIGTYGCITDYKAYVDLHREIMEDLDRGFTWNDFNKKYKPTWKSMHSEMVKACPKPREKYHKPRNKKKNNGEE
jgi:hypothetical protein